MTLLILALACGPKTTAPEPTPTAIEAPAITPVDGPDCPVKANDLCYANTEDACAVMACDAQCVIQTSLPPRAACMDIPSPPVIGGTAPVIGDDGVPVDCPVMHDALCYQEPGAACAAAGCPDTCNVMESYPAQIACPE